MANDNLEDDNFQDLSAPDDDIAKPDPTSAAEAALELLKQLITLSSGALAVSATFANQFSVPLPWAALLPVAWLSLIVSTIAALKSISAIVKSRLRPEHDWSTGIGKTYASWSQWSFVVGIGLIGAIGSLSLFAKPEKQASAPPTHSIVKVDSVVPCRPSACERRCPADSSTSSLDDSTKRPGLRPKSTK